MLLDTIFHPYPWWLWSQWITWLGLWLWTHQRYASPAFLNSFMVIFSILLLFTIAIAEWCQKIF
jgi:hypothetical protein